MLTTLFLGNPKALEKCSEEKKTKKKHKKTEICCFGAETVIVLHLDPYSLVPFFILFVC